MKSSKKNNVVYSTNPNFSYDNEEEGGESDLTVNDQNLKIYPDRKNRKGKTVTVVSGFIGQLDALKILEKELKSHCGSGGTVKDGEIYIQGNFVQKVSDYLKKQGYRTKISGI